MTKVEYLKAAIANKAYVDLGWLVSIFSIINAVPKEKLKPYGLSYEGGNYYYYDDQLEDMVKIEGSAPLFTPTETIHVSSEWLPIIERETDTTVGRLITNAVCINDSFKGNIPYINKKFSVETVETIIGPILLSDPEDASTKDPKKIYVSDYIEFINNAQFISNLSSVVVISATPKVMIKPDGLDAFMVSLVEKYKGKLSDPVALIDFEDELRAFDDKYLKDDPSYGLFISGKVKNIARKKLFLSIGSGLDFKDKSTVAPILTSLAQGWNLNTTDYVAMMNDIRFGSFSRGSETVKGGVTFKALIRATNSISVSETDCKTTHTLSRIFDARNIVKLLGRNIVVGGKVIQIETEEQASSYIDKKVNLRTPLYCTAPNNAYCHVCSGSKLTANKNSLVTLLSEISSIILKSSLKIMHGTQLSTTTIDINKHLS